MKKPIVKNWIKYWTTTIAVSGMMVMGACGNSNETAGNTVETAETEVAAPVREEVANTETEEVETEEQPIAEAENTGNAEFERTSARSADNSASFGNMDQHIEEHKEVNKEIRQTLIDEEGQNQSPQSNPQNQPTGSNDAMSSDQNTYDRQSNTDFNQDQEMNTQESPTQDTPDNSSSLQEGNNSMNQPEEGSNASIYQQDAPANQPASQGNPNDQSQEQQNFQREADAPQTGTVEYGTDRQGTTEMEVESDQQGTSEMGNTQTSPSGTNMDSQNQGTIDQTQPNNSLNTQQDTNTYDRQSNTNMQEGPDAYLIILEERRAEYDSEAQQAMDDINRRYNERRESMRGQINEETGAYVSPDVDPQPQQGISQVIEEVHSNLEYPQNAAAAEIEGTVFVNFVVDENGEITDANAVEDVVVPSSSMTYATSPLDPTKFNEQEIERTKQEMKEAAIEAVKSTSGQWEPAQQNGQAVKGEVQIPVVFDIERIGAGAAGGTDITPGTTQE